MLFSSDIASLKPAARTLARLSFLGLAVGVFLTAPASALVYTYENATPGTIPEIGSDANCNGGSALVRVFDVNDSFTVTGIALGLNITHEDRGQIRAILNAPNGSSIVIVAQNGDTNPNYDIYLSPLSDGGGSNPLNDGDNDPLTEPYYHRLVNINSAFFGGNSAGDWTLRVCDRDTAGNTGTFNRARLVLTSSATFTPVCTSRTTFDFCPGACDEIVFPGAGLTTGGVTLTQTSTTLSDADGTARNFRIVDTQTGGEFGYYVTEFDADAGEVELVRSETLWGFSPVVQDLQWKQMDQDRSSWEDYVRVRGLNGTAEVPYNITTAASPAYTFYGEMLETDNDSSPGDVFGNAFWNFSGPVSAIRSEYWTGDDFGNPAQQFIGYGAGLYCAFDYGDAPNTYGTQLANGARHVLGTRELWLGANRPDGESNGQPGGGVATADDLAALGGVNDEDGLVGSFPACPNNGTYSVTVSASDIRTAGTNGVIRGYIDWNRDGDFGEGNERSRAITVTRTAIDPSNFVLTWGAGSGGGGAVPANCGGTASTFARFRYSSNTAAVDSPTGQAADGEVEDYQISASTLPVTLARVETVPNGNSISVRFTTSTESGNVGFRIWGRRLQGRQALLGTVKSKGSDSFVPQSYEATVPGVGITSIQIEDVSAFAENRMHGPFAVGTVAGEAPAAATIDWAAIKDETGIVTDLDRVLAAELSDTDSAAGLASFAGTTASSASGLLLVRNEGIHRVTYEELRAAGIDLAGVPAGRIAIVDNGVGVPRAVSTVGATFGPGGSIEFLARPQLTLASPVDAYVIKIDSAKAVAAGNLMAAGGSTGVTSATDTYRPNRTYSPSAPNGDPWFDDKALAWGAPATLSRTFDLPNLADGSVNLTVRVWGYGDQPGVTPDHHVIVKVNGTEVGQGTFDGVTPWEPEFDVAGVVSETGNTFELLIPGDTGYAFDYIALEGFEVSYRRSTVALGERFKGTVQASGGFAIGGFGAGQSISVWQVSGASALRGTQRPVGGAVSALAGPGVVYAASQSALYRPGIAAGIPAAKASSAAQYVIVTHPAFASSLGNLVALEQGRGFTTEVVTTDRIFAAYSDHASSAASIKSFLSASIANGNLRYALLVGADTTDPYDHLGAGAVSYVPTDYRNFAQYVVYSPTDESLVDVQGDGLGDVAIGRLPVRTPAELEAVVEKLLAWEANIAAGTPSALLAAGASDSERMLSTLNEAYAGGLPTWSTDLAQVDDSDAPTVRQAVLDSINAGTDLVSYVGHSSMGQWDFTPILKWQDAGTLTNAGMPNLFTAWGCWNSYYVEPTIESLSARLLREPNAGAAGAIGATTLTSESSHRQLGNLFFARVNAGARTVGEAFHGAKADLQQQGGGADAIYGMTLLGDPAMSLPATPSSNARH
jgi:subtilisin-like proprotein convertase family protein